MDTGFLLPGTSTDICRAPIVVYHPLTKEASWRRICKEAQTLFPCVSPKKRVALQVAIRTVLEAEESETAWEVRIHSYGHPIVCLRNTEHTLQPEGKRMTYYVSLEQMKSEQEDYPVGILLATYWVGFLIAWFLQTYWMSPIRGTNRGICAQ
jgi:hypothetical protein